METASPVTSGIWVKCDFLIPAFLLNSGIGMQEVTNSVMLFGWILMWLMLQILLVIYNTRPDILVRSHRSVFLYLTADNAAICFCPCTSLIKKAVWIIIFTIARACVLIDGCIRLLMLRTVHLLSRNRHGKLSFRLNV